MQRLFDTGTVVFAELANPSDDIRDVVLTDRHLSEVEIIVRVARLGQATQIENHFDKLGQVRQMDQCLADVRREDVEESVEFPVARSVLGKILFQKIVTSWTFKLGALESYATERRPVPGCGCQPRAPVAD